LRFLALLLGLGEASALLQGAGGGSFGEGDWQGGGGSGAFELIINALTDRPESLRELDKLVQRLQMTATGSKVLPGGFEILWKSVTDALTEIEDEGR
jgi:hypothetical protein